MLCWLLNSSIHSFGPYANLLISSEWDTILPDLLLPRHWAKYPGFNYEVQLCIRTKDPLFSGFNPLIKGLDNYAELIGPSIIANLSTLMAGFTLFLFGLGKRISRLAKA